MANGRAEFLDHSILEGTGIGRILVLGGTVVDMNAGKIDGDGQALIMVPVVGFVLPPDGAEGQAVLQKMEQLGVPINLLTGSERPRTTTETSLPPLRVKKTMTVPAGSILSGAGGSQVGIVMGGRVGLPTELRQQAIPGHRSLRPCVRIVLPAFVSSAGTGKDKTEDQTEMIIDLSLLERVPVPGPVS